MLDRTEGRYARLADNHLVARCLEGDAQAWDALIRRYEALVYSTLLKAGLARADADDLFQDVALALYHHLGDVRDTARLSSWLISTARREVWRLFRRRAAQKTMQMPEHEEQIAQGTRLASPEDMLPECAVLEMEKQQLVREALTKVRDRCRILLTMLYCDDPPKSYVEVTQELGIPIGSIGPTRARCLEHLRKALVESGY